MTGPRSGAVGEDGSRQNTQGTQTWWLSRFLSLTPDSRLRTPDSQLPTLTHPPEGASGPQPVYTQPPPSSLL